ncbi:MAG: class I SAM-dependent methyltransferase [Anaerolineales bacterium]
MNWHRRYTQQATWTRDLRSYLFEKAGLVNAHRVLEAGCGTGAILSELTTSAVLYGLDVNPAVLAECQVHAPKTTLVQGDALSLPYSDASFEIVYCHFLLLWVTDPLQSLLEMKRVTQPGGHIIAFAEPDYLHRVRSTKRVDSAWRVADRIVEASGCRPKFRGTFSGILF